jgi:acyl-coenzyme A thioesterase PaaI-like protein
MPSELYRRVERSILICRETGLAFPSIFMNATGNPVGDDGAVLRCKDEPLFRSGNGELNWCAFCGILDTLLSTPSDIRTGPRLRPATAHINLLMTGVPLTGALEVQTHFMGFSETARVRQALVGGTVRCGGVVAAQATSAHVLLTPPGGKDRSTWPWPPEGYVLNTPAPSPRDDQALVALQACEQAESAHTDAHPFIDHFWCGTPQWRDGTARLRFMAGPHLGNRAGQVQGGLLLGVAAHVACIAANEGEVCATRTRLSNISAWFLSPATDAQINVLARITKPGRSLTLVSTQITDSSGKRVLEAVSQHVAV